MLRFVASVQYSVNTDNFYNSIHPKWRVRQHKGQCEKCLDVFETSANLCIHGISLLSMYEWRTQDQRKKTTNNYERNGRWTNQMNATSACVFSNIWLKLKYIVLSRRFGAFLFAYAPMSDFFLFFSRSVGKNRMHGRRTTVSLGAREKWFFVRNKKTIFLNVIQSNVYALLCQYWCLLRRSLETDCNDPR